MKYPLLFLVAITAVMAAPVVRAQNAAGEIAEIRSQINEMKATYEARISELETRLAKAERMAGGAKREAEEAVELVEQSAIDQAAGTSAANTYNPSIGAVLTGRYADIGNGREAIPGFQPGGEIGTGGSGYAVGEAEINLKANIDDRYYGNLTVGIGEDDGEVEIGVEEAWLQTTSLSSGLTVRGGRFFSATGYQNSFHFHADDFIDRPLPYQAFLGGRYSVDGIQARWIAPASLLVEVGSELNWGGAFPATANAESSPSAWTLFTKLGGDVGNSHSWQFGLSHTQADVIDRGEAGALFSGDSDLTVVDLVWKWAPLGNSAARSFKVQSEYFSRSENGVFDGIDYDGDQSGWYLQGVWQFVPRWRVGLRHDQVDSNNGPSLMNTQLEDPSHTASRNSLMLDWSNSEFSRLRLQYTTDSVLPQTENRWYLQYIMSLGAHGAHQF